MYYKPFVLFPNKTISQVGLKKMYLVHMIFVYVVCVYIYTHTHICTFKCGDMCVHVLQEALG